MTAYWIDRNILLAKDPSMSWSNSFQTCRQCGFLSTEGMRNTFPFLPNVAAYLYIRHCLTDALLRQGFPTSQKQTEVAIFVFLFDLWGYCFDDWLMSWCFWKFNVKHVMHVQYGYSLNSICQILHVLLSESNCLPLEKYCVSVATGQIPTTQNVVAIFILLAERLMLSFHKM